MISITHHPGFDGDLIISEPEGGQVVIKLPPHMANIIHDEFAFVIGLLRDVVEETPQATRAVHAAKVYLKDRNEHLSQPPRN